MVSALFLNNIEERLKIIVILEFKNRENDCLIYKWKREEFVTLFLLNKISETLIPILFVF